MPLTNTFRPALLAAPAVALALAGAVSAADPMEPAGAMASDHMGASGAMASDNNMAAGGAIASDHMATGGAAASGHMASMPMKSGHKHRKHHPMSAMSAGAMAH